MATQNNKDEEIYRREYTRMQSLETEAFVRQTSVSVFLYNIKNYRIYENVLWMIRRTFGEACKPLEGENNICNPSIFLRFSPTPVSLQQWIIKARKTLSCTMYSNLSNLSSRQHSHG